MFKWIDFHFSTFFQLSNIFPKSIQAKGHANPALPLGNIQLVYFLDLMFCFRNII